MLTDGQRADRGRKTRLNDVDGLVRGVKSAVREKRQKKKEGEGGRKQKKGEKMPKKRRKGKRKI